MPELSTNAMKTTYGYDRKEQRQGSKCACLHGTPALNEHIMTCSASHPEQLTVEWAVVTMSYSENKPSFNILFFQSVQICSLTAMENKRSRTCQAGLFLSE